MFVRMENEHARFANSWERIFGDRIRELRTTRGWTQEELANRMTDAGYSMHQTTAAKMESGARPTSVGEAAALASIFGVTIAEVFQGGEDDPSDVDVALQRLNQAARRAARLAYDYAAITEKWTEGRAQLEDAAEYVQGVAESVLEMPGFKRRVADQPFVLDFVRNVQITIRRVLKGMGSDDVPKT